MDWALWAFLLIAQNGSFTWVSRARNSGSIWYNGVASVFSNLIWFLGQILVFNKFLEYKNNTLMLVLCGLYYTAFCVAGSVSAQYVLMKYVERGKLKVGS